MNVGYVFDEGYVCCAIVSIFSLLKNNKKVHVWIFDDGITCESKMKIEKMIIKNGGNVTFLDISSKIHTFENVNLQPWRGRYSVYVKLFVESLLPSDMKRIIIIDADTIIDGSIEELYSMDISPNPCAMALEAIPADYHKYTGLGQAELYNTGVIVIDLFTWRNDKVENRLLFHLLEVHSRYLLPEEDPISLVLKGQVFRLEPKYNFLTQFYLYNSNLYFKRFGWDMLGEAFYSRDELINSLNEIKIYHFIDTYTNRPWNKNNCHPFEKKYNEYLTYIECGNDLKKKLELTLFDRIKFFLRKYLPEPISKYMYFLASKYYYTVIAAKFYSKK